VDAAVERMSIARSLLVQFAIFELVSVVFFKHIGAGLLAGIIAPFWSVAFPVVAHEISLFTLMTTGVAYALLGATLLAWLRFRSRIAAHTAFGFYSVFSMFILLGFAI
jgi:hypothetical protein